MTNGSNGQSGFRWRNWAGNVTADPACYFKPNTIDDLVSIVKQANAQTPKQKIRVVGSSHSWSALAQTDGYMVDLENFDYINVDRNTGLVTVGAGALMLNVEAELKANGLAIPANVVTLSPRIGGLVATGCHGSGYNDSIISDAVQSVSMVLASGESRTFSAEELADDPFLMDAVRLNLGTFGIMYEIVLKAVPTYKVHCVDATALMSDTIDHIQEIVTQNDYVEIFWFPFNPDQEIWLKTWNISEEEVSANLPKDYWGRIATRDFSASEAQEAFKQVASQVDVISPLKEYAASQPRVQPEDSAARSVDDAPPQSTTMSEMLLCLSECVIAGGDQDKIMECMEHCLKEAGENFIGAEVWSIIAEHPSLTRLLLPLLWHLVPDRDDYVVLVNDAMHYQTFFPKVAAMAMMIPIDPDFNNVKTAWNQAIQAVEQAAAQNQYPLNINVEARFVSNSNCLLSPMNGSEHFCILELISYITTPTFNDFYARVGQEWMKLGWNGATARPHWPKQFDAIPDVNQAIRQAYGDKLQKFLEIRDALDPDRLFVNPFLEEVFYGD